MKIYLASSWRNKYFDGVLRILRQDGFEVYNFKEPKTAFHWSHIDDMWQSWNNAQFKRALTHPLARRGFFTDFQAMEWADACLLVLPCGRSAHLEAGWFAGRNRPLAIFAPEAIEPELMYRMADPGVFCELQEAMQALKRTSNKPLIKCNRCGKLVPDNELCINCDSNVAEDL